MEIDIGGLSSSVGNTATGPTWGTNTINVSSLIDGTIYDVLVILYMTSGGGGSFVYATNAVGFVS